MILLMSKILITDYLLLVITIFITAINAVVSGAEVAFFSLTQDQISEIHTNTGKKTRMISGLLEKPEKLSGTIFMVFNLLNLTIVALFLSLHFSESNLLPFGGSLVWLMLFAFVYIVLFVEVLPKRFAAQQPLRFVQKNYRVMGFLTFLFTPFAGLLAKTTKVLSKYSIDKKYDFSLEELSTALELTSNKASNEKEKDMLEGIIRFRDKTVEDILVSRSDMVAIEIDTLFPDVINFIVAAGFSRIPVFQENPDNINGILYVKDLLPHLEKVENFRWQSLIRPAYFVPGTKRIDDLLEEFRANKNHMAIIVDEYGGTSGIVTMEDILEEIVGDISDEYDEAELPTYLKLQDGTYLFEGRTPLEDFLEITELPEKEFEEITEEADTIAGLMLELKGDFPNLDEIIEYKGYGFKASEMDDRRIIKVKFIPKKESWTE